LCASIAPGHCACALSFQLHPIISHTPRHFDRKEKSLFVILRQQQKAPTPMQLISHQRSGAGLPSRRVVWHGADAIGWA